ncbi:LOW QUALITY PROTEIN: SART-1 family protein DOT2-like [Rutidosis leptorrhynchoides]|uniref:LOW QUALITY PROTEIN: SART-1 family protein DOT2-like n=1 Tax=Rutidosis leptorrhynchoides TaxID=125765 RepID=UPI003A99D3CE
MEDRSESPRRGDYDDDKSSRNRTKDNRKKSSRELERDRRKGERDDRDRKSRDKDYDRARHRDKERDRKDRATKDKERDNRDKDSDKRNRDRDNKHKDRDNNDTNRDRDKHRDRTSKKEEDYLDRGKGDHENVVKRGKLNFQDLDEGEIVETDDVGAQTSASELAERIQKMKEERMKKNSEGASEILSWVSKSRKIEEKKSVEKQKALQLSRKFEEQDNIIQGESDDEEASQRTNHLAGVKVLHGLDKVMEGGAVVLTLKDQSILADGDINEDIDMLENVELGEQKQRDEAYKAAKKKTGVYDDKFKDDPASEKKMLPQYDDPITDEGVALDARGRFTGEAEKKLEELRKRIQGTSMNRQVEDLNSAGKILSDYYTEEEMLKFKKPKKKKSLRKKEKLDLEALEAEAVSSGLGTGDLGSRKDGKRKAIREEEERADAEMRSKAYQLAYAKADEASKSLRMEQTLPVTVEEDENQVVADDEDDLYKSLERARKLALKKQEPATGPQAIALLAASTASTEAAEDQNTSTGEPQENKVVFTEMNDFVWGLQLNEEAHVLDSEDVFMEEDEPTTSKKEMKEEAGGWSEINETEEEENHSTENKEEIVPDATIHEAAVGKGLSGALRLLKDRGTLKESIEWGGRNMDKKKSKLVGIVDNDPASNERFKDIRIERTDEFGRILTPKEAFRMLSHKFHGKGPGKMKLEKRQKQYQEELKLKQMKNSDTPSLSVARMRDAQAQLQSPYLVLSGHVKPGQTSDPRSGFGTVEKDFPGGLTPMLGNSKVEHFLGIKRPADNGGSSASKKQKK